MSRSKGAGGLQQLIAKQGGERIRFFLLRTHYRSTVLFSEEAIQEAAVGLEAFYRLFKRFTRITGKDFYALEAPNLRSDSIASNGVDATRAAAAAVKESFLEAMDDDFNTGGAIAELFELARIINKYCDEAKLESGPPQPEKVDTLVQLVTDLRELSQILGLFLTPPGTKVAGDELLPQIMQLVIDLRAEARAAKNFAVADAIRNGLAPIGITLEDRPGGKTEWSGGDDTALNKVMDMLLELRQTSRANKDFATADTIRQRLATLGVTLEDRAGATEWTRSG